MSITDELRKWWVCKFPIMDKELHKDFTAIADRIDAEHENACAEAYGNGVMSVPIALDESAWVELPKDADGEYIRVGDVMEWPTTGETFEVVGIGEGTLFYVEDGSDYADWTGASTKSHYHAPTVEDVLREFSEKMNENLGMYTGEAIDADEWRKADAKTIAEYASKLKLAEEEDA